MRELGDRPHTLNAAARASGLEEDGQGGREPVQEGLAADRADLATAEEAGERRGRERLGDGTGVVIGCGEHVSPAAVAGEEQRPGRPPAPERAAECLPRSASAE